jgi:hypothetical protein
MDDGTSFEPAHPDLQLVCSGGHSVMAHSCLLAYASAPLRPAIRLVLQAAAAQHTSCSCSTCSCGHGSRPLAIQAQAHAAASAACDAPSSFSMGNQDSLTWAGPAAAVAVPAPTAAPATPAALLDGAVCSLRVDGEAGAWQLALQFLDPSLLHKPQITWVSSTYCLPCRVM